MKKISLSISTISLALFISSSALASSKVCFGSTKNDETKGVVISAEISTQAVTIKGVKNSQRTIGQGTIGDGGTYPAYNTKVKGRDGKTYLEYQGEDLDEQNIILVDENLLQNSTSGLLQIRARGEGFFNSVFVCKDARQ